MGRKKLLQDLERIKANPPPHITDVDRFDDDGISFTYWYRRSGSKTGAPLKLISTNVDDYPEGNQFILFTDDADIDSKITNIFVQLQAIIDGSSIFTALREISEGLHQALTLGLAENPVILDSSSQAASDFDADDFGLDGPDEGDDDANFGLDDLLPDRLPAAQLKNTCDASVIVDIEAIKRDLRAVKQAGFKIGVHGDILRAGIICVAVRFAKLGISEEAMQAWSLSPNQYLILLIRYQRGYKFLNEVLHESSMTGYVDMRVGLSDTYKPTSQESFAAFNQTEEEGSSQLDTYNAQPVHRDSHGNLKALFIGRPINDLLRDRFLNILKFRHRFQLPWGGAERLYNDRQGSLLSDFPKDMTSYKIVENPQQTRALPEIVMADAFSQPDPSNTSLPLVAMQFVLRHIVRCTEFCLVCHCPVEATFEALKPYVCSKPLCLYQFLAFGFGPAAEWEVLSQPYVVDLLVSLCYEQTQVSRIREFPLGISLRVPILPHYKQPIQNGHYNYQHPHPKSSHSEVLLEPRKAFKAKFVLDKQMLIPAAGSWLDGKQCVKRGDWIVLVPAAPFHDRPEVFYCCISGEEGLQFILEPVVQRSTVVNRYQPAGDRVQNLSIREVDCYLYSSNFDELPNQYRHHAILSLLDTIPSITDLRKDLLHQQEVHRDPNLNILRRRCPQASIDLLRWIIASNRSCIMQVDEVADEKDIDKFLQPSECRVSGMDEWMQFRFAQGAPDKEQRFLDCVESNNTNASYPTLFAWHGSPLYNWHSIIRQGLNFDEVIHGRANGNGVYMSPHLGTSLSYTGGHAGGPTIAWPNSALKVSSVVSLQEVVNNPNSFVSRNPHFVVAEKDWIQTRYLFVKTGVRHSTGSVVKNIYPQDPLYPARGANAQSISIPITAISKSRRPDKSNSNNPRLKKRKVDKQNWADQQDIDDAMSIATDDEDIDFLNPTAEGSGRSDVTMIDAGDTFNITTDRSRIKSLSANCKKRVIDKQDSFVLDNSKTDFVPGSLDTSGIRFLNPPEYASISATKALMRAFLETIKVQEETPLHELGFYIDPNRMENMYQWIVELHSFDKTLPIAHDMKAAGITSIVFEMLFTNTYPFSPPFVRVVKPRFLDPMMGGGGHITSGGAICMELLTSNGWSAVCSIESILLQVKLAMSERERPARLLQSRGGYPSAPYGIGEAIAAYKRFCLAHNWKIPPGLDSLQSL